ncbi:hypothetical protein KQY10_13640 [Leptospira interrogans]|uniref:Uncharacterized protein n=1 Tax=Leptospira interrogans serovar Hardjo str. Norma TaxID=1279460 RepID=A0A0M3TKR1_LEPIR|nr:hypothetical protein [Leptospira interrogans]ALE37761.1 hypothetical protein G436_0538 [Leptospira interrogans serovar Hardjo str. Norma]EKO94957.1 hypothetical protein LEP1GSC057_0535 [Leptospira interrogans str. Brem 329]MCD1166625.1 hypothetical protein [Leptospira interrogans]MCH1885151.1 hypothetical protein [Leptospira interrogans]MCH1891397.1 hypothetical protein [Leptospira interrogans]
MKNSYRYKTLEEITADLKPGQGLYRDGSWDFIVYKQSETELIYSEIEMRNVCATNASTH